MEPDVPTGPRASDHDELEQRVDRVELVLLDIAIMLQRMSTSISWMIAPERIERLFDQDADDQDAD